MSDPLTGLVKKIDEKLEAASAKYPNKLGTFVIIGNTDGRAEQLRGLATCESLQRVTLCIGAAPQRYEVNPDVDVTVVIYSVGRPGRQTVTANFALRTGELDEAKCDAILAALANVLPK
jgi:hypothetical protein